MTDQQRGDALGIEGHPVLLTPNMDAIAGDGVRFTRCYSTCPVCIPARRSFMSGQFPATHGMVGYRDNMEWEAPPTLPGVLKASGYHTYLVGRNMHLYPRRKRYGFDHMVVTGGTAATPGDYERWFERNAPEGGGGYYGTGVMHNDWTARPWHLDESLHQTNWTVNQALDFLQNRDPSSPFFLVTSFLAPHPPLVPPAFYMERYLRQELPEPVIGDWATPPPNDGLGDDPSAARVNLRGEALRSARAAYYGLINHIDDQIRRLLNPVNGVDKMTGRNTIVVFTSDHGEMLGDHYLFRKSLPYEASARVPLLIRTPHHMGLGHGTAVDHPVCLEDIMPTLLDLAGAPIPESVEGRSLVPLLRGEDPSDRWRSHIHIECAPSHHALTDGREKYIWYVKEGTEQFFNLVDDPDERRNLVNAPDAAERVRHWRAALIQELSDRPEGFSDGTRLIAGRPYNAVMERG